MSNSKLKLVKVTTSDKIDETVRTVKITKCSGDCYWYRNKIGEYFDVRLSKMETSCYEVIANINGFVRRISKSDCREMGRLEKIERIKERM